MAGWDFTGASMVPYGIRTLSITLSLKWVLFRDYATLKRKIFLAEKTSCNVPNAKSIALSAPTQPKTPRFPPAATWPMKCDYRDGCVSYPLPSPPPPPPTHTHLSLTIPPAIPVLIHYPAQEEEVIKGPLKQR